jgi:hypothetical protein
MAARFRLVTYYNLPRDMNGDIGHKKGVDDLIGDSIEKVHYC